MNVINLNYRFINKFHIFDLDAGIMEILFILNNQKISTDLPPSTILLDFIRYDKGLRGVKIGCREGDCGACTILVGELKNGNVYYKAITSCLTPLGNIHGKHVVTVEGLNLSKLSPIQKEIAAEGGTQCGFCTPGFVASLTAHVLNPELNRDITDSISGNICRCTGYKSIEKAITTIGKNLSKINTNKIDELIKNGYLPEYFKDIKSRLNELNGPYESYKDAIIVGGGTDLYVQQPDRIVKSDLKFINQMDELIYIRNIDNKIHIGAGITVSEFEQSDIVKNSFNQLQKFFRLFASRLIKNTATLGGNIVNASPIGDSIILFLAVDAQLKLRNNGVDRTIPLRKFYLDYKVIDLVEHEIVEAIIISKFDEKSQFNFEKVSKRSHLDIASVNSAIYIKVENEIIVDVGISAGGIAPIPKYLQETSEYLSNRELSSELIKKAAEIALSEISPISDIRGSKEYKLLLLRQLIYVHFIELFPEKINLEELLT